MTRRCRPRMRNGALFFIGAMAIMPGEASAQQVRTGLEVSGGAEIARNPYLEADGDETTVAATAEVRPRISYDTEFTTYELEGYVQTRAYASEYGFEANYGANASVQHRASERLTLRGGASFISTEGRGGIFPGGQLPQPGEPGTIPALPIDDITVLGTRGRIDTFAANAGLDLAVAPRDALSLDNSFQDISFSQMGAADYRIAQTEVRYTHVLDGVSSVGAIVGYQFNDYENANFGDAETLAVLANYRRQLSEIFELEVAAGANRTSIDEAPMQFARTETSLSARAKVCYRTERENACIDFRRDPQPTAFAGVSVSDRIGGVFERRVTEFDTFRLVASYSRTDGSEALVGPDIPTISLASIFARYERRFAERLLGYVQAGVDRIYRDDLGIPARTFVGLGVTYTFGRSR